MSVVTAVLLFLSFPTALNIQRLLCEPKSPSSDSRISEIIKYLQIMRRELISSPFVSKNVNEHNFYDAFWLKLKKIIF